MSKPISDPFDRIYQKSPSIVARQIAGEMILVPIRQSMGDLDSIYLLNETALFAWQLFDGNHTLADIQQPYSDEFDVDEAQAGQDLLELVDQMEQLGALVKA